jgi:hypothetical protein
MQTRLQMELRGVSAGKLYSGAVLATCTCHAVEFKELIGPQLRPGAMQACDTLQLCHGGPS